ncbi:hypothetical protein VOLCADRAFT_98610 [Volvox carteri f. nagariensis]|uniref:Uncharacterized protein n=1 Tax=Volvox carteri f. nagariensis TaxID=3068 RepID=D8UFT4_VOLCA|nr:uncharacterized protein VOLCADRAFT_98610 [Volvox carteri f. nagariensis]EFJ41393.1 hypothetical protein VOLCADRAFT_98610 [Volvox carteri f. nagariensis]|eukprot:XP_002957499.1 hypothetical protein VOLCADRAFT_98610 [Volvox carteri f. nagariensis]
MENEDFKAAHNRLKGNPANGDFDQATTVSNELVGGRENASWRLKKTSCDRRRTRQLLTGPRRSDHVPLTLEEFKCGFGACEGRVNKSLSGHHQLTAPAWRRRRWWRSRHNTHPAVYTVGNK